MNMLTITISLGNRSTIIALRPRRQQFRYRLSDDEVATTLPIWTIMLHPKPVLKDEDGSGGWRVGNAALKAFDRSQGGQTASAVSLCGHKHDRARFP